MSEMRDQVDQLSFLPYASVYDAMRLSVYYVHIDTQKMRTVLSTTINTTSTYYHTHTHAHARTYTTNFPRTHTAHSFTDSDCATFEKGEWVC